MRICAGAWAKTTGEAVLLAEANAAEAKAAEAKAKDAKANAKTLKTPSPAAMARHYFSYADYSNEM